MTDPGRLLTGKQGLIMGVANDRSLAWGIALLVHAASVFWLEEWREAWVRREQERQLRRLQGR